MLLETKAPKRNLISLTPLIDVVFILLLFFMLSSTFTKTRQLEMHASTQSMSDGSLAGNPDEIEFIKVIVLDNQNILLDGQRYLLDGRDASDKFASFVEKDQAIIVAASSSTNVQSVITALDYIKGRGVKNVSLAPSVVARSNW